MKYVVLAALFLVVLAFGVLVGNKLKDYAIKKLKR